jgi:hypothetical protein
MGNIEILNPSKIHINLPANFHLIQGENAEPPMRFLIGLSGEKFKSSTIFCCQDYPAFMTPFGDHMKTTKHQASVWCFVELIPD